MSKYKKQAHVVWKCDFHIVWTPKYRFRILTGVIKDLVEQDIKMLCEWKDCEVIELNVPTRPCTPCCVDSAKGFGFNLDGSFERQAGNQAFQKLSQTETEAIFGESFLVEGILCQYGWHQRRPHS